MRPITKLGCLPCISPRSESQSQPLNTNNSQIAPPLPATSANRSTHPVYAQGRQSRNPVLSGQGNSSRRASLHETATQDALAAANNAPLLQRSASWNGNPTGLGKSLPFNPEMLHLMESKTGKESKTLKFGTPEFPRIKNGEPPIKLFEREGHVLTGKVTVNEARFFIAENKGISTELIKAIESVRNGGRPLVFGMDLAGQFIGAPETQVPDAKDNHGKSIAAFLGHVALNGAQQLRMSGEISMMPYEKDHARHDPENPEKKRLVLINKSGRYGREGVRTEQQLKNIAALIEKAGVLVDEVIFRQKKNGKVTDTLLFQRE